MKLVEDKLKHIMVYSPLLIILLQYLAWCFLTILYSNIIFAIGFSICQLICYLLYILSFVNKTKNRETTIIMRQMRGINCIVFFVCFIMLIGTLKTEIILSMILLKIGITGWCFTSILCMIYAKKNGEPIIKKNGNIIKGKKELIAFLLLVIVLCYDEQWCQYKWDGLLYYLTCRELDISSLSDLAIYGHISQTYGVLLTVIKSLLGNVGMSMYILNILLLVSSLCSVYGIVKVVIPSKNEYLYVLLLAIYAFAPSNLGMVCYYSLDFPLQCLFPVVVYFTLKEYWVYQCVVACLFCFTKEPAVVIYFFFCVGVLFVDIIYKKKGFFECLKTPHYYYMAIPGVLWTITFKILGPWSAGNGAFSLDMQYIINKLKVMYITNFNWLFVVFLLLNIMYAKKHCGKLASTSGVVLPVFFSQIGFTIFSCVFKTVNHVRYLDITFFSLYILVVLILAGMLLEEKIINGTLLFAGICMLVSSYLTIDPITKIAFRTVDIGDTEMITTGNNILGDGMIYNRQMMGMEEVMNEAISMSIENDAAFLVPAIGNSTYYFDGMSDVITLDLPYIRQIQYWDNIQCKRVPIESKGTIKYEIFHVGKNVSIEEIEDINNKIISYVFIDSVEKEYTQNVLSQIEVLKRYEYEYRGWRLYQVLGKLKK